MFRNQYDSDVTVWSPQGRLHQVEYAMEAVKQGAATVAVKNKSHAILVALKRATSELSAHQKKIIPLDVHIGMSISGLTADARILGRHMRTECMSYTYSNGTQIPVIRLMNKVTNMMQLCTQRYDRRPFGVGLLVAGYDHDGPHIFQICPSAIMYECRAMAIGSRSQSARTYLEKHLNEISTCPNETELIKHGLRALRDSSPNDVDLNNKNVAIAIVGKDKPLQEFTEEETQVYLDMILSEERRGGGPAVGTAAPPGDASGPASSIGVDQQPPTGSGGEDASQMDTQ
ncbi:proteasome subunit alpha type-1-like [Cimex lectularius]|uniref:Proteasome subunit alpha type n=1 Tax=Cimex lectularius TaxID=79782 RepID=A0A8I6RB21_CIMLE|nr:proteasome subunit alpha type-1-like [Cimex lectularius]